MEPTTMPAIWPPERPNPLLEPVAPIVEFVPVAVADAEAEDVEEGKRGGIETVEGWGMPVHRLLTLESTQQESVAFGELVAQNAQSPCRFVE